MTMKNTMMVARSLSSKDDVAINGDDDDAYKHIIPEYEGEWMDFGGDDDDYEGGFEMPLWLAMIMMFFIAGFLCWLVFYLSYKHERVVEKSRSIDSNDRSGDNDNDVENQKARALSVRKYESFNGQSAHTAVSVITEDSYSVDSSSDINNNNNNNSPTSSKDDQQHQQQQPPIVSASTRSTCSSVSKSTTTTNISSAKMVQLLCAPRCVLCSKAFRDGEDIVYSNPAPNQSTTNPTDHCQHQFHKECLIKFWNKNPKKDGTCPICKQQFVAELTADA